MMGAQLQSLRHNSLAGKIVAMQLEGGTMQSISQGGVLEQAAGDDAALRDRNDEDRAGVGE